MGTFALVFVVLAASAEPQLAIDAMLLDALKERDVLLEMRDGTTLRGRLLGGTPANVVLMDGQSGRVVSIDGARIAGIRVQQPGPPASSQPASVASPPPVAAAPAPSRTPVKPEADRPPDPSGFDREDLDDLVGHRVRVRLEDGESMTGRLVSVAKDRIFLRTSDGKTPITFAELNSISDLGRAARDSPGAEGGGSADDRATKKISSMDVLAASTLDSASMSWAIWGWIGIVTGGLGCAASGLLTSAIFMMGFGLSPYLLGVGCASGATVATGIWGLFIADQKKKEADLIRSGQTSSAMGPMRF